MAWFKVNPVSTVGVQIAAASTGNKYRFLAFGISNHSATRLSFRLYDGTAAAGTQRIEFSVGSGVGHYWRAEGSGASVFPKSWFTAGNAIECSIDAVDATGIECFGDAVAEA